MDADALHEAATLAPRVLETRAHEHVVVEGTYLRDIVYRCQAGVVKVATVTNTTDADLIVAVLNAYADGTLIERTPVGGERMSECGFILAQGESCPKCQERKPLDGYDWRSRWLTVVASVAVGTPQSDALYSLAAYIEALEAERDWLARWCALYATAPGKSATMTLNERGEQQVAAWLAAAAIARVKGGTK
jgi:hypothetical protein